MEELDQWKVVAVIVVFAVGMIGGVAAPLMGIMRRTRHAKELAGRKNRRSQQQSTKNSIQNSSNSCPDTDSANPLKSGVTSPVPTHEEGAAVVVSEDVAGHKENVVAAVAVVENGGVVEGTMTNESANSETVVAVSGVAWSTSELVMLFVERFVTSVGCGGMLTVAIVHVLPDAVENMEESGWIDEADGYPLPYVICLGGILLAYLFHMEVHYLVDGSKQPVARMHMLEAGLVVHSVLIGFAMGITQEVAGLRALTIAIIFHQLCEGFALGSAVQFAAEESSSIADDINGKKKEGEEEGSQQGISVIHQLIVIAFFSLSTPIGVIIGWFGVSADNAETQSSFAAQGTLQAITAGILISAALCDFMPALYGTSDHGHGQSDHTTAAVAHMTQHSHGGDAGHSHQHATPTSNDSPLLSLNPKRRLSRLILHVGVLVGSAALSVLAIWA